MLLNFTSRLCSYATGSGFISRMFSSQVDPNKRKGEADAKAEIFDVFNHKIQLETSKIKNTFGLKMIDAMLQWRLLKAKLLKTQTPLVVKTLIVSEAAVFIYTKWVRKHLMLSRHYKGSFKELEQKIIQSPPVKFLMKQSLSHLVVDSMIYYFLGKSLYITQPGAFYKTMAVGVIGSIAAHKINLFSKRFLLEKYSIANGELFPNHINLIPSILVASSWLRAFDVLIPNKSTGLIPKMKKHILGYFYVAAIGRISRLPSLFTSPSLDMSSTEGVSSIALSLLLTNRVSSLLPFLLTHYLNPYTIWLFLKTRNSLYQQELDALYAKKTLPRKALAFFRFTSLNSLAYMINI